MQFGLWSPVRVYKSWADSPSFSLLLLWCHSPSLSFPRKPSHLPVPHPVGLDWESLHCGPAIFVALSNLFELLLVFLPLNMAHRTSFLRAVLCNRDISHLLHTECKRKVLVYFHCTSSGSSPKGSVEISQGHSMVEGGGTSGLHLVQLPSQSRFRALSSWVLSVSETPQPVSATHVRDRQSVWPPSESLKSSFLHITFWSSSGWTACGSLDPLSCPFESKDNIYNLPVLRDDTPLP